ncbi:hypothetical protein EYR40_009365 [Pleurotus pulmonarius]|nr:hypothetical protein EYR36_005253 [Pleurotus pulmonarius]KAF4590241.1 hypothetical protein EYR38_009539 [Pleurotus pulmonarius]KAF4590768.1 hypothetical protein EYR40_009365 [Pleurotus pulmonarius]
MYIKSLYPQPAPIEDLNFHHSLFGRPDQKDWPDYTLFIDASNGHRRTHREFVADIYDGATALGASFETGCLGLRGDDGEMVGIMSDNSMEYVSLIHSLIMITTPFALISSYSTPFELKHSLKLSKATCLFVQAKYLPLALAASKEAGISNRRIFVLGGRASGRTSFTDLKEHVRNEHIPRVSVRPAHRNTLAYLVFSSGTSGLPKAVMISHGNLQYSISQAIVVATGIKAVFTPPPPPTPEGLPIFLAFLPFHHTYGLHAFSFRPFLTPVTVVILPRWNLDLAFTAISKYRITHLPLIPSVIHQIVNSPKSQKADWSSVMSINSGAAYLPPDLSEKVPKLLKKEIHVFEGYGMSECTIAAIGQPFPGTLDGKAKTIVGSTGLLLPGLEARIVREDGTEAEVNEPGELWLRGGNIALGYWNNDSATKSTFVDGWLHTGDSFRITEDHYFFFADRAKDTLKVSGSQVSPVEIENVLLEHPDKLLVDATVAGVSGGRTSDEKVPRAWVVLSDAGKKLGHQGVIKALEVWHEANLSKYKWLRGGIEIVNDIPKNPTGKVLRRVLQEKYENKLKKKAKL